MDQVTKAIAAQNSWTNRIMSSQNERYERIIDKCITILDEISRKSDSSHLHTASRIYNVILDYCRKIYLSTGETHNYRMYLNDYIKHLTTHQSLTDYNVVVKAYLELLTIQSRDRINQTRLNLAQFHHNNGRYQEAIDMIDSVIDILSDDELVKFLKLKVSSLMSLPSLDSFEYSQARQCYEKIGFILIDSPLLKWTAVEYFFYATLCGMITDGQYFESTFNEYLEKAPILTGRREIELLQKVFRAIEESSSDKLAECVMEFDQITPLTDLATTMLLKIKKSIVTDEPELQ